MTSILEGVGATHCAVMPYCHPHSSTSLPRFHSKRRWATSNVCCSSIIPSGREVVRFKFGRSYNLSLVSQALPRYQWRNPAASSTGAFRSPRHPPASGVNNLKILAPAASSTPCEILCPSYTMPNPRGSTAMVLQPIRNVVSASALYPFKGIYYFCAHHEFWPLFGRRLIPLVVTSIVVLGLLFTFTYLPQVAFLAIFHGPVAWFNAVFLVLGEGQVVIALLFEALLVDETLVNVFDVCSSISIPLCPRGRLSAFASPPLLLLTPSQATLIREGQVDLVSPSRILFHDAPNSVKMLGKPTSSAVYSPFSFRQIAEFVLFLPLNLIPIIGTPFFLVLTGARAGPFHHYRYFKLRGLSKKEKKDEIRKRKWKYTWYVSWS